MIHALIFSYQNKNLKKIVDLLLENTETEIFVLIFDKHTINRSNLFSDISYENKAEYIHVFWDEIAGPAEYKANNLNSNDSEYFLVISDDVVVSKNWDRPLISFLKDNEGIVSGSGKLKLLPKDLFFLGQQRELSKDFSLTNFTDKNFVFGKTKKMQGSYPTEIKYYGEDELLSLNLFNQGVKVYSAPSQTYEDLKVRTMENSYVPFSLEHNYNLVIQRYKEAPQEFLDFHGIGRDSLFELPYNPNDVEYNPYLLDFQDMDARKFLSDIKGIS